MDINPIIILLSLIVISVVFFYLPGSQLRNLLVLVLLGFIGYFLVLTVSEMPVFGDPSNPAHNYVAERYIEQGVEDTGSLNLISSVITDYRAFDTLGEATVLFLAIAAALSNLVAHKIKPSKEKTGDEPGDSGH